MRIQQINQNNFQGYDARPLKGFLMSSNCYNIANEMSKIGQKEGFEIYSFAGNYKNRCAKYVPECTESPIKLWAQDYWTVVKGKLLALENDLFSESINEFFNLKFDFIQKSAREASEFENRAYSLWGLFENVQYDDPIEIKTAYENRKAELLKMQHDVHIAGGNLYIIKNQEHDDLLIGQDEAHKYNIDQLQAMYGVDNVIFLPQMDYHIDLFVRPLDNKRILVADDSKSLDILYSGLSKFMKFIDKLPEGEGSKYYQTYSKMFNFVQDFKENVEQNNRLPQVDIVENILKNQGYDVIRVPGRVYNVEKENQNEISLKHFCNYMNANVIKKEDDDLVYITNKSNLHKQLGLSNRLCKKIGFDFEQSFIDSILPYVKKEHIYFINGDENFISETMLTDYQGGIHCVCAEIPKE